MDWRQSSKIANQVLIAKYLCRGRYMYDEETEVSSEVYFVPYPLGHSQIHHTTSRT
jgi:hypothetical protein